MREEFLNIYILLYIILPYNVFKGSSDHFANTEKFRPLQVHYNLFLIGCHFVTIGMCTHVHCAVFTSFCSL